jgi:hypothetical protein
MTVPVIRAHRFHNGGSAQVFDLLTGTTLGSQVGSNFSTIETASAVYMRPGCTYCEFLGKEYVIQGITVRERNQGGTGNWGVVYTKLQAGPTNTHSGLHIVHPNGVPTMVYGYVQSTGGHPNAVSTIDGINFTEYLIAALSHNGSSNSTGTTYRNALIWCGGGNVGGGSGTAAYFDFNTLTGNVKSVSGGAISGGVHTDLCVIDDRLFLVNVPNFTSTSDWEVQYWSGSVWSLTANLTNSQIHNSWVDGGAPCIFEDPSSGDLITIVPGSNAVPQEGEMVWRIASPAGTPVATEITNVVLPSNRRPGSGNSGAQWYSMVDNNTDPVNPVVYLYRAPGNGLAGTYTVYQWDGYGDGVTPNDSLMLNPITLIPGGGATSISTDFSICNFKDGVGERLPTVLSAPTDQGARAELGVNVVLLTHSMPVTNGPFVLNDTITAAPSGATGTILIDNTGSLVVFPTNSTPFANLDVITGTTGGGSPPSATLSANQTNSSAPPLEVSGGTKRYFQVYGDAPSTVTIALYYNKEEGAPDTQGTIVSVTLESGSPATTPSISGTTIINMTPDLGVCLWSLIQNSIADGFSVGDVVEISLKAT